MMGMIIYEGSYYTGSKNIVEIIIKNSFNEDVGEEAEYHIRNGFLHLSINWDEVEFGFLLKKD